MKTLRPTLVLFVLLSAITGVAYPALVTGIAQAVFPKQANGSHMVKAGKPVGSRLMCNPSTDGSSSVMATTAGMVVKLRSSVYT